VSLSPPVGCLLTKLPLVLSLHLGCLSKAALTFRSGREDDGRKEEVEVEDKPPRTSTARQEGRQRKVATATALTRPLAALGPTHAVWHEKKTHVLRGSLKKGRQDDHGHPTSRKPGFNIFH
jgi:hypothetical protein